MRLVALTLGGEAGAHSNARYHSALVTTRFSIDIIRRAKEAGLPVTCGTSINHVSLNETDVGDYRTFLKKKGYTDKDLTDPDINKRLAVPLWSSWRWATPPRPIG
jgi:hypothetical protein